MIHPFQIFSTLSSFYPYALSLNGSLARSKSAGMNHNVSKFFYTFTDSFLSKANLSTSSDLTTSYLLGALFHQLVTLLQTHPFYYLLPLCQQTYKSPPYLKIILSLCCDSWDLLTIFPPPLLSAARPPEARLPLCQQTILYRPRGPSGFLGVLFFRSSKSPPAFSVLVRHIQKFLSSSCTASGCHGAVDTLNFLSEGKKVNKINNFHHNSGKHD